MTALMQLLPFFKKHLPGIALSFKGLSNHALGKYNFVNPIEVGLKETYCP